jgi:hypothetical protein
LIVGGRDELYDFGTDWCSNPLADFDFYCYINALNDLEKDEWWRMCQNDRLLYEKICKKRVQCSIENYTDEDMEEMKKDENSMAENEDDQDEQYEVDDEEQQEDEDLEDEQLEDDDLN